MSMKLKKVKPGVYAVRILEAHKKTHNNELYVVIKFSVIVDLENFYYEGEEFFCAYNIKTSYKSLKKLIHLGPPLASYEYIFTEQNKASALRNLMLGLVVDERNLYNWYDIDEYCYDEYENDIGELTIPF